MPKHGKKYLEAVKQVEAERLYTPQEAVELLKKINYVNFDATVELHMQLGVDPRHADQMVRGTASLPSGSGKEVKVLVFAQGEKATEAETAGADFVGVDDYIKQINEGWLGFDVAIATPDMMSKVASLGRRLGPRGLMPNPRTGTVTMDIGRAVKEVKAGRVEFRVDKTSLIHLPVGKLSFTPEQLLNNLASAIDAIVRAKPSGAKGQYIKSITVCSTMSPGIRLDMPVALAMKVA
jgi:large subunit ribosomal protein L1